jgi:hypothetical protein
MHKVIFYPFRMHRSNYPVHPSPRQSVLAFYDGNAFVLNTSHKSGADTLFAIVQVQYEEHALHTDATEFSNSSLYSTAEMRYASLPSPHIRGPLVFSNHKNTHDHCYHTIPINVHYFLIVNKHIYFKKISFLSIIDKILANIIYLLLSKKKYKKSHSIKKELFGPWNPFRDP